MPRLNRQNIDKRTNKPNLDYTESGIEPDKVLNRAHQTRRDDDVVRTPKRSIYDIDYAVKTFIEKDIQPFVIDNETKVPVPVIFAHGEKWDNVRRLGYMRDEKGLLQCPAIMIKRNSFSERDNMKTLDVNKNPESNYIIHKGKYSPRNRYEDTLLPLPMRKMMNQPSLPAYVVNIPKYVTVEYELLCWTDFTTQMNDLVNDLFTYNRFAWGSEFNTFNVTMGTFSFETVNTVTEDRIVRCSIPLTVYGTLLAESEVQQESIRKMYSIKKVSFDMVLDVGQNIFESTSVPVKLLQQYSSIISGNKVVVSGGGSSTTIDATAMAYLTQLTDKGGIRISSTQITVAGAPKLNPTTNAPATINEFDIYINGQYIDKPAYTWTPDSNIGTQTITFDTTLLGYTIDAGDLIVVHGRWA
jgi:hypothetical protein